MKRPLDMPALASQDGRAVPPVHRHSPERAGRIVSWLTHPDGSLVCGPFKRLLENALRLEHLDLDGDHHFAAQILLVVQEYLLEIRVQHRQVEHFLDLSIEQLVELVSLGR